MRESAPNKPGNWIASARLEYEVRKFERARKLIQQGCDQCPRSEEVWLVNIEMNHSDLHLCKVIVAEAIKYNSKSLKLWLKAAELETDNISKKRVLRKALEFLPKSETLWLEIVKYEDDNDLKIRMLEKATELLPTSIDMWLELVKIQPIGDARKSLNKARKCVEKDDLHLIYIEGAKLEESATQNEIKVNKLITKCFKDASDTITKDEWLRFAVECEQNKFYMTAKAITLQALESEVTNEESEDKVYNYINDAQLAFKHKNVEIARSMFMFITSKFSNNLDAWDSFIEMEKSIDDNSELYTVYEMAISANPKVVKFYLMYAKDKWVLDNDVEKARQILTEGLEKNKESEDLWFAAIKLEWKSGSKVQATQLFESCRDEVSEPSARVWYKHITLERIQGRIDQALKLADEGLAYHQQEPKLYLQLGQIYEDQENWQKAIETYELGTKLCLDSSELWISWAKVEEFKLKRLVKARSILDQRLAINNKDELTYLARIQLEIRSKNIQQAKILIAKALKDIPKSGLIWSENIKVAKPQQRKNFYKMALNSTDDDSYVVLTIALDLWSLGKISRAKQFFQSIFENDSDFGDAYIYYLGFLLKHGTQDEIKELETQFAKNEPRHGLVWCPVFKNLENFDREPLELLREEVKKLSN
ncbi:unnamed protein product [Ambrosiozyma monospora]|uniref:Unnamed protein product n=1 Tax=Ambrosiozyma monospora TaxID=43982 RepID=A0ACB5SXS8_AMBMO|nr:unnamed protein product [Ambrosiozyma monospora]